MRGLILMFLALLVSVSLARSNDSAAPNESPPANAAPATTDADTKVKEEQPFRIPPGYKTKTRGDKSVYCRKSTEIGSRFKIERCFTMDQLKLELVRIANEKEEFERGRRQCVTSLECNRS